MGNESASNYSVQPGKSIDYPNYGHAMDVKDHPANTVPTATEHHDGTVLATGINKLRGEMNANFISPGLRGSSQVDRMDQNGIYDAVGK